MKLRLLIENVEIISVNDDGYHDFDDQLPDLDGAWQIAKRCGINIFRNKNLSNIAIINNKIVGATWAGFDRDSEYSTDDREVWVYDFDVAVDPQLRAMGLTTNRIGPKLIEAALTDYRNLRRDVEAAYIRVWVVNPKLAKWLEANYNFEPESSIGPHGAHMVYMGE